MYKNSKNTLKYYYKESQVKNKICLLELGDKQEGACQVLWLRGSTGGSAKKGNPGSLSGSFEPELTSEKGIDLWVYTKHCRAFPAICIPLEYRAYLPSQRVLG